MKLKYIWQGIGVSLLGAVVWLSCFLSRLYEGTHHFLTVAFSTFFGLLISSVYVVPLGAVLGLIIPTICLQHAAPITLLYSASIGIIVSAVTAILVAAVFELTLKSVFLTMFPVCSLLLCAWALFLRARRPKSPKASPALQERLSLSKE